MFRRTYNTPDYGTFRNQDYTFPSVQTRVVEVKNTNRSPTMSLLRKTQKNPSLFGSKKTKSSNNEGKNLLEENPKNDGKTFGR